MNFPPTNRTRLHVNAEIEIEGADEPTPVPLPEESDTVTLSGRVTQARTGIALVFDLARGLEARRQSLVLAVPPSGPVRRVFDLCEVSSAAPVYDDAAAAVSALRAGAPG